MAGLKPQELLIILVIVIVIVAIFVGIYNGLVTRRNRIDEALGQIEVQLKRRHDLIPNLVQAVKGYMGFEQDVLTAVTEAKPILERLDAVAAGLDQLVGMVNALEFADTAARTAGSNVASAMRIDTSRCSA